MNQYCDGHWLTWNGQRTCLHHFAEECPGRSALMEFIRDTDFGWYDGFLLLALLLSGIAVVLSGMGMVGLVEVPA